VAALSQTVVLGVPTNRGLLVECLQADTFRRGEALVPFLSAEGQALRERLAQRSAALHATLFAALWRSKSQGRTNNTLRPHFARPMRMRLRGETLDAAVVETAHGLSITMSGQHSAVAIHDEATASARFSIGASTQRGWWAQADGNASTWHVQIDGTDAFIHDATYEPVRSGPGNAARRVLAPFNGRVVAVHATPGQTVAAGDTLLVIESMKLEHAIAAPRAAVVVSVAVEPGQQVASQQLLMGFE
jgi:3-methylcrotonyl-CoA carboxylase alpha subunit/geranyl-CoA carboxylase alpha subunit